ncbi:hypothetical protein Tco_0795307 [Tanacetum coccineum]
MKMIVNIHKVQDKCDGPLTPNAAKVFKLIEKAATKLTGMELSGIPCIHAVAAIWDMASNGTDTGIPESNCNLCHWLATLKEMYMFKINPVVYNQRGCKSKKSGLAGGGSQGGGDAGSHHVGVGGSQTTQTTHSLVGRAQHPSFLHASPTKITKSSAKRTVSSA